MKSTLATLLLLLPLMLAAQKPRNYTDVTNDLSEKILAASLPTTPVRLAVVPFAASQSSLEASSQFGEYITETTIGLLSGHSQKIKLFERTRLDAVLKEQEFILTDIMKPAAALKIGQLVPIDALLSGTYTKLKSYIDVNTRMIDVASGEIIMSFNGRIKMNKNLAALFKPATGESNVTSSLSQGSSPTVNVTVNNSINSNAAITKTKEQLCKEKAEEFSTRLNDLSTEDKINAVVRDAIKTPFDNQCGQLHYDVMYSFTRYKLNPSAYHDFLIHTLDTIAYPTHDDRTYNIVRYFSNDGVVDDSEWQAGFHALARVGDYSLSTYISYLLGKSAQADKTAHDRLDNFFQYASAGKIGLPRPLPYETAFTEMMEGVKNAPELGEYVYATYSGRLQLSEQNSATVFSELVLLYKNETRAPQKSEVVGWIGDFTNAHDYAKADEQLYEFALKFMPSEYGNHGMDPEFNAADLKILTTHSAARFATYATRTQYTSQKEDRINFCVQNGIAVPGVIPTMDEAATVLAGNNLDEQLRVMKLLTLMGAKPAKIENSLIALFNKRSLDDRAKLSEIQTIAITVLGTIRTSSTTAIDYMIGTLPHYGNDTEAAEEALVKIGKPAVPALIIRLDKTTDQDGGLQFQLITMLGKIGKDAAPATKSIQRVLKINSNSDVQYAGEAALQAIH